METFNLRTSILLTLYRLERFVKGVEWELELISSCRSVWVCGPLNESMSLKWKQLIILLRVTCVQNILHLQKCTLDGTSNHSTPDTDSLRSVSGHRASSSPSRFCTSVRRVGRRVGARGACRSSQNLQVKITFIHNFFAKVQRKPSLFKLDIVSLKFTYPLESTPWKAPTHYCPAARRSVRHLPSDFFHLYYYAHWQSCARG